MLILSLDFPDISWEFYLLIVFVAGSGRVRSVHHRFLYHCCVFRFVLPHQPDVGRRCPELSRGGR